MRPQTGSGECLKLSAAAVQLRKSGIEFVTQRPLAPWTEMTVSLEIPNEPQMLHCTGIIVDCKGSPQAGYHVSMLFIDLSSQSLARLSSLARAHSVVKQ